jgi:hypothetical protein
MISQGLRPAPLSKIWTGQIELGWTGGSKNQPGSSSWSWRRPPSTLEVGETSSRNEGDDGSILTKKGPLGLPKQTRGQHLIAWRERALRLCVRHFIQNTGNKNSVQTQVPIFAPISNRKGDWAKGFWSTAS